ncbi:LINE-1 retrotransposable element ORF2 protein [Labeo rohita]|uniref:LINE-1 retrotransposable element ORF2 protein n=1 Tax=Labeo rohita TaxID=84645 RepID=A0ABQ8L6G3_LABRO|nr:LINE-1 retrotransposable element ORF2 protein [Labeo rohita]
MIKTTLTAWWQTNTLTNHVLTPHINSPIWNNPDFTINHSPLSNNKWKEKGITHLHHLFPGNTFITFTELMQRFNLGKEHYYYYLQIKNSIKTTTGINDIAQPPPILKRISTISNSAKPLSKLYALISSIDTNTAAPVKQWEKDLNISTDKEFWETVCGNIFIFSTNTNIQLIQYKVVHRTHITQHKMFKMGLENSDRCINCSLNTQDTYLHAVWLCPPVNQFWTDVTNKLTEIFKTIIPMLPVLCLIGDTSQINPAFKHPVPLLMSLAIAKKTILLNWKNKCQISVTQWIHLLREHIIQEQHTTKTQNQLLRFNTTFSPLFSPLNIE